MEGQWPGRHRLKNRALVLCCLWQLHGPSAEPRRSGGQIRNSGLEEHTQPLAALVVPAPDCKKPSRAVEAHAVAEDNPDKCYPATRSVLDQAVHVRSNGKGTMHHLRWWWWWQIAPDCNEPPKAVEASYTIFPIVPRNTTPSLCSVTRGCYFRHERNALVSSTLCCDAMAVCERVWLELWFVLKATLLELFSIPVAILVLSWSSRYLLPREQRQFAGPPDRLGGPRTHPDLLPDQD